MCDKCINETCKHFNQIYTQLNGIWDHHNYCKKLNEYLDDKEILLCELYEPSMKCFNCKHGKEIIYETGTIDCIDYHCKLQDNKMIFSDSSWALFNYSDFPDCQINKWGKL